MFMPTNCSLSAPLSQSQKDIWQLISTGLSVSKIATKLKTTRQYVNQTRLTTQAKLATTLLEVAEVNDLQVTKLIPQQAILLGYHPALKKKAIVTYTTSHGLKVWYWHDNPQEVTDTAFLNQTRQYLMEIATERGIEIPEADKMHPAKLAHVIFSKLIPELER
jgi:DNA-binding CsgD family transcriptional regulator